MFCGCLAVEWPYSATLVLRKGELYVPSYTLLLSAGCSCCGGVEPGSKRVTCGVVRGASCRRCADSVDAGAECTEAGDDAQGKCTTGGCRCGGDGRQP